MPGETIAVIGTDGKIQVDTDRTIVLRHVSVAAEIIVGPADPKLMYLDAGRRITDDNRAVAGSAIAPASQEASIVVLSWFLGDSRSPLNDEGTRSTTTNVEPGILIRPGELVHGQIGAIVSRNARATGAFADPR
ncbi:MAG TPA: hypothetical protein VFA20_04100, partial [Myxococcaceae bacterium]|nr:hypothetical protein [Myxococcaceae bacterium]